MTHPNLSGQPGNTVPLNVDASSNQIKLSYQFIGRMPVEAISSAQNQVLTSTMAGLIPRGAASSGSTITLPPPIAGEQFLIYFTAVASSAATVIRTNSSLVTLIAGGGNTPTTNTAIQLSDVNFEDGKGLWCVAINSTRWAVFPQGAQVSSAYSSDAASTLVAMWQSVDSTG